MALEYDQSGNISLKDRDCYFETGNPVNTPAWDHMKKIPETTAKGLVVEISEHMILETFNSVRDQGTGMVLRSSWDQFKSFLYKHGLKYQEKAGMFGIIQIYDPTS